MKIAESLRRFRKKFGLSQKDIADVLEIKQPSYAPYETKDVTPSANVIIKLAKAYNVSSDYLLGLVDEPRPYAISEIKVDTVTIEDTDALTLAAENDRIMDYHDALANVLAKQGIKI